MDRGRGNRGSRGRGNSGRGSRGGRGRGRGGGAGGSPYIPKFPIGAGKIQEALDDPSADLGALVSSPGFKKLLSTDSFTGENKIYAQENDPDNIKKRPIYPTVQELTSTNHIHQGRDERDRELDALALKVNGPYNSIEEYAKKLFDITREDFMRPLRNGIRTFMENKKVEETTVYQRSSYRDKRQMLKRITDVNIYTAEPLATEYDMLESKAFFLPVKNVLERLQADDFNRIPFQNILVTGTDGRLDRTPSNPPYLDDQDTIYNMNSLFKNPPENPNIFVRDQSWNNETSMIIKEEQLRAMKSALQGSVSVIQGPPGTGKTFIAKLVMRCLLDNKDHWYGDQRTPILLICYTNHALDQFLEGIHEFEQSIVRYGGRTKSDIVQQYTIHEQRRRVTFNKSLWKQVKVAERSVEEIQSKRYVFERDFELAFTDVIAPEKLYDADAITEEQYQTIVGDLQASMDAGTFNYISQPIGEQPKSHALNLLKVWLRLDYLSQLNNLVQNLHAMENYVEEELFDDEDEENVERMSFEHIEDQRRKKNARMRHEENIRKEIIRHVFSQPSMKQHEENERAKWNSQANQTNQGQKKSKKKGKEEENNNNAPGFSQEMFNAKYVHLAEKWIRKLRREEKWVIDTAYENAGACRKTQEQLWDEALRGNYQNRQLWYGSVIEKYQEKMQSKLEESNNEIKEAEEGLANVRILQDTHICKQFRLVAMTATIATKNFRLIQNLGCKIVMAEESAELPESHLVACLTEHTQQMILIGDHQQLRPKVNCYELEKKCNLDISLFERLIKNNFEFVRLGEQHRMQPNISTFMSTCFYENLKNHVSTNNRESDKVLYFGDRGRVQFINYGLIENQLPEYSEAADDDGTSKSNAMEDEYVFLIAELLIKAGYDASKITILTFYIGQFFQIREKVRLLPKDNRPDVQTVDNYQGQENQVVILSTVRSNSDFKGGFATIKNRACVALSRARSALIVVGNLEMLRNAGSSDNVWIKIMRHAEKEGVVSEGLKLECPWHPIYKTVIPYVKKQEFQRAVKAAFPLGGCTFPCPTTFSCGHRCPKTCHNPEEHQLYQCGVMVRKNLPCGHEATIKCHIKPENWNCQANCEREISSCGHGCKEKCYVKCSSSNCKEPVQKTCGVCNNTVTKECRKRKELEKPCKQKCIFKMKTCGHECRKYCHSEADHHADPCLKPCEDKLPCGHPCPLLCKDHTTSDVHEKYQCKKQCERSCKKCGKASCNELCFVECKTCVLPVDKKLPCEHVGKNVPCNVAPEDFPCQTSCKRMLQCGHQCNLRCFEDCATAKCQKMVPKELPCTHNAKMPCFIDPQDYQCKKKCKKEYECGHPCVQKCFESCDRMKCTVLKPFERSCEHIIGVPCNGDFKLEPCDVVVTTTLECYHKKNVRCHELEGTILCEEKTWKLLPCGHQAEDFCHKNPDQIFCHEKVQKSLSCGHTRDAECGKTDDELVRECKQPCLKTLTCGHKCKRKCNQKCDAKKCKEPIEVKCKDCDGFLTVECSSKRIVKACTNQCKERLACGHQCPLQCHQGVDFDHSKVKCMKRCEKSCGQCGKRTCTKKCHEKCEPCPTKNVRRTLPCGHQGIATCSEQPICNEMCERKLKCGHQCESLCSEPCTKKCPVKCSRMLNCGHMCTKICSEPCNRSCSRLVDQNCLTCSKKGEVGKVECRVEGAVRQSQSCVKPCKATLECGHECEGNCTDCFGGLFHKPCQKICDQTKVCGHICKDKCHKDCPPCEEKCTKRCAHSVCNHPCFEMCTPCMEECPEPGCGKRCSDDCDHELSKPERCSARRLCGHQCELIRHNRAFDRFLHTDNQCAQCHPAISVKFHSVIMMTEEYEEDELYVYLPDCQHRIEWEGLDGWVQSVSQESEFKAILCPKCKARMASSRYTKIFNNWNKKYERIKGTYREADRKRRDELSNALNSLTPNFPSGRLSQKALRARSAKAKFQLLARAQFMVKTQKSMTKISEGLQNMIDPNKIFFARINQIASLDGRVEFSPDSILQSKDILLKLNLFASWSKGMDKLGFRFQRLFGASSERQFEALVEISNSILFKKLEPQHQDIVKRSEKIIGAFTIVTSEEVESVAKAIAAAERGMRGGHWFECPNGHPYFIGECGGAMENAVCPCGARIGGRSHQLTTGNRASNLGGGYGAYDRMMRMNPAPNPNDFRF
ncbi:Oidioi.mRNA.OKI2018_I69.PAR.g10735.t1.cds [Oikopleura dioica]|uniref:Oidioi.mRNA.OKI2018_I69.PAR.g10735.t1.cds n=1 Tax=Oikopleura dioica TaxID=34765 RepID=A0ABN7RWG9_OIKDI|nr:Oidioi.mRNA.OKI2018_I69.PAR.g10735.t1.cds [Oikopleura dioica]